jgi:hypothetical protein
MKFYPPGLVTRKGAQTLKDRIEPLIIYTSQDEGIQWGLCGGLEPQLGVQEGAALADGISGLFPSFKHVELKGARQDGVSWQHTVYEPAEYDMEVEFTATPNNARPELAASAIRRVLRDWMASWDPRKPGKLQYITPDQGCWYCAPRLLKSPPERQFRAQARRLRQKYTWTIRNDEAFWRGVDSVSTFHISNSLVPGKVRDLFNRDDVGNLGPQWAQTYIGTGGTCETDNGRVRWFPSGTAAREVRNRFLGINEIQTVYINGAFTGGTWTYTVNGQTTAGIAFNAAPATVQTALEALSNVAPGDVTVTGTAGVFYTVVFGGALAFTNITASASGASLTPGGTATSVMIGTAVDGSGPSTSSDNQVVTVRLGDIHEWPIPAGAFIDIWGRWNGSDASPTAVRARIGADSIVLSRFNAGTETVMYTHQLPLKPTWWENWTLVCGVDTNTRWFKVLRNGFPIPDVNNKPFLFKETGTGSVVGSSNRGSGFGMKAAAGTSAQGVPPSIDEFNVNSNITATQSGHLNLTNFGDQDGYGRYLVYGPFTKVSIANGPNATDMVTFGPLGDNQIALLTTIPRLRGVVDLSPGQPSSPFTQEQTSGFLDFFNKLLGLAQNNNTPPLLSWFESLLGMRPPQGQLYSLLKGRFNKPLPPKPTGGPPDTYAIACTIEGGNADSKIVAALTPLRRWPE